MYCEENVFRGIVQEFDWTIKDDCYSPVEYTRVIDTEPDVTCITEQEWKRRINENNGPFNYDEKTGRPLNPNGRTGISGRGNWPLWGPNASIDIGITRWKRQIDCDSIFTNEFGNPILQFLCSERDPIKRLPMNPYKNPFVKKETFFRPVEPTEKEVLELEKIFENSRIIYKGPVEKDPRNTDHAWSTTLVLQIHEGLDSIFSKWDLVNYTWQNYDPICPPILFADQSEYIQNMYAEALRDFCF